MDYILICLCGVHTLDSFAAYTASMNFMDGTDGTSTDGDETERTICEQPIGTCQNVRTWNGIGIFNSLSMSVSSRNLRAR